MVGSIAECSLSIMQYFWPALSSDNRSSKAFIEWPLKTGFTVLYISEAGCRNDLFHRTLVYTVYYACTSICNTFRDYT